PGFETFSIKPFLSSRITRVKGDVPTPKGTISFSIDSRSGELTLSIPEGTTGNLAIPKSGKQITNIELHDFKPDRQDDHYIYFQDIPSGNYRGRVNYKGKWKPQKEEQFKY